MQQITSALSRITPEVVARAAALVRRGQVYDLGAEISEQMPSPSSDFFTPYRLLTYRSSRGLARQFDWAGVSFYTEAFTATPHVSTHIDALCHVTRHGRIYGGHHVDEVEHDFGMAAEGIETVPPIVTRGVLLDIAELKGLERLPDGYEIGVDDLRAALSAHKLELRPGDAVLLRTGKMRQYAVDNQAFLAGQPGIGLEGALWLYEQGMALLGSDTTGTEPQPVSDWEHTVHVAMLLERGVHLIEWMQLEPLAGAPSREFLFVCLPLKIRGASGSWVRPTAVM